MSNCFCFNPLVEVHDFDGATQRPMLVCEVPTDDPNAAARYLLPVEMVEFLKQFDGSTANDSIIQSYLETHPQYTAEKLGSLVYQYCVQKKLLIDPTVIQEMTSSSKGRKGYLYLKVKLFPARLVSALSTPVSWLFHWKVLLTLLPVFIASQVYFFVAVMPHYHFNLNSLGGFDFFYVTLITSFLGLFHELGHAAALNHYGFRRSDIGWGLYISFPVFYTDLSDAWRLKRNQRAMVDLGGIYFHCITLLFLLALIAWKGIPLLVYSFFFIDLQIASALYPFFRMDGYWLVGDLFGIADLQKRTVRAIERLVHRLFRIKSQPDQLFSELNKRSRIFLLIYVVASAGFFALVCKVMFVQLMFQLLPAYPKLLSEYWKVLTTPPVHLMVLVDLGSGLLWKGLALYGFLRLLYRTILGLWAWLLRTVRSSSGYREPGAATPAVE